MYGAGFALFCVVFCSLAPYNDSTMMHKTSLFHWAGLVHNADFAFRVFLFVLFLVCVFVLRVFCSCLVVGWFCFFGFSSWHCDCPTGLCSRSSASPMIGFTNAPWRLLRTQSLQLIRVMHSRCDRPGEAMDGKKNTALPRFLLLQPALALFRLQAKLTTRILFATAVELCLRGGSWHPTRPAWHDWGGLSSFSCLFRSKTDPSLWQETKAVQTPPLGLLSWHKCT